MGVSPELLAPAGDGAAFQAALAAGADAVYLGLGRFNARLRAENFTRQSFVDAVAHAHRHGRRVFVTLNTLLSDAELAPAVDDAAFVHAAGADGVIVQDAGLAAVLHRLLPDLPVHASTQMTILSPEGVRAAANLGVKRAILARELSLAEIRACVAAGRACGVGIEVFVHGALCAGLSGQCWMSYFASGRSGNRGVCEQCCRLRYRRSGGREAEASEPRLELSMHDLASFRVLPELVSAGVAALKIEGRLKGAPYVAAVTRLYRQALDTIAAGKSYDPDHFEAEASLVFNRGFTDGYLRGRIGDDMRQGIRSNPFGRAPDGTIEKFDRRRNILHLRMRRPAEAGDGYALVLPEFTAGFHVIGIPAGGETGVQAVAVRFGKGRLPPIPKGAPVWRNSAERFTAALQPLLSGLPEAGMPVTIDVSGAAGERLRATFATAGAVAEGFAASTLSPAAGKGLDAKILREKLGGLGGTRFALEALSAEGLAPGLHLPISELKTLRRELVGELEEMIFAGRKSAPQGLYRPPEAGIRPARRARTAVAVASPGDIAGAVAAGADVVYLSGENWLADGKMEVARKALSGIPPEFRSRVFLKIPVYATGEALRAWLDVAENLGGVLAGSPGILREAVARGRPAVADFSCNCLNVETAMILAETGALRVTWSLEVSPEAVAAAGARLAARFPEVETEAVVAGEIPVMLTRQPLGLPGGARESWISENGRRYDICRGRNGWTAVMEFLDRRGHLSKLAGVVDVVRYHGDTENERKYHGNTEESRNLGR
ncbi:MAG: U32 family peptidase [Planctomycetota bacterium]